MKKIFATILATGLLAAIAPAADAQHYRNNGWHDRSYSHNYNRGNNWVAPALGGFALGAMLGAGSAYSYDRYSDRYNSGTCANLYVRDYYGNYVYDSYGRPVLEYRCW